MPMVLKGKASAFPFFIWTGDIPRKTRLPQILSMKKLVCWGEMLAAAEGGRPSAAATRPVLGGLSDICGGTVGEGGERGRVLEVQSIVQICSMISSE